MTFKFYLIETGDSSRYVNITDYKLKKATFSGYDSWIRPVVNMNTTTNISFDLTLLQILEMVMWTFFIFCLFFQFVFECDRFWLEWPRGNDDNQRLAEFGSSFLKAINNFTHCYMVYWKRVGKMKCWNGNQRIIMASP